LYVAKGMLSAAVCGNVFTSPDVQSIVKAILTCTTPTSPGCLLIVKNYTGDVLNFKLAAEIAREQKRKVETVIVADDVALIESKSTTGRRGIAGTVFVHKICGALAESGASLEEIKKVAEKVVQNVNSMGVSLGNCVIPGSKKPAFQLKNDEIELGLGIHGKIVLYLIFNM
jgi:dihydroxyacetone kinase-like protein